MTFSSKNQSANSIVILVCGNPGRGKSSICNALVQEAEAFKTGVSPVAVTTSLQSITTNKVPPFKSCVVVDVPGLIEPGHANEKHNAEQLKHAVDRFSHLQMIVLFVADGSGKIDSEDVEAYEAICKDYLRVADSPECVIVANRAPNSDKFRGEWAACMRNLAESPSAPVCFLPKLEDNENTMSGQLHAHVLRALHKGTPAKIDPSSTLARSKYTKELDLQAELQQERELIERRANKQREESKRQREEAIRQAAITAQRERDAEQCCRQREYERLQREAEDARRERERLYAQEEERQERMRRRQQQHGGLVLVQDQFGRVFYMPAQQMMGMGHPFMHHRGFDFDQY